MSNAELAPPRGVTPELWRRAAELADMRGEDLDLLIGGYLCGYVRTREMAHSCRWDGSAPHELHPPR